jgi:SAM-dependent methyltransferase
MVNLTDISPKDFCFDPQLGMSLRDRLRDTLDTVVRRPLYKRLYNKKFAHLPYPVDLVLPEKGMSILARRQWTNQYLSLKNARILVIGCGSAWDFGSYLRFHPKELVGVDLYNFESCWKQIKNYTIQAELPTKVSFHQADIGALEKLGLGEFDVICSDAVFEHCQEFEKVLNTLYRLLQPKGIIYAAYGPLWYCWGGDHFSGRGGTEQGYNHLLLDPAAYKDYYRTHLRDAAFELQNGGRYIELDLFSKLSSQQYIDSYTKVGFNLKSLIVEFSGKAESLRSTPIFGQLLEKFPQLTVDDFLVKSHLVLLEK